jgi:ABC-type sugar transport system ATPase subunit
MLEVAGVSKAFGATLALRGVSLTVRPGEIHGLCGRNGAGKSTLVKILSGLERPDGGTIRFFGEEVRFHRPRDAQASGIAVVDQELSVVPALTVEENIRLGALDEPFVKRARASRRRVKALLERLGLHGLSPTTLVEDLSMAERQLVEIARLLDRDARLLILDEPTASLSHKDSLAVMRSLRQISDQQTCILYVSHRLSEVLDLCSTITVLRDGEVVGDHRADLDHESLVRLIVGEEEGAATSRLTGAVAAVAAEDRSASRHPPNNAAVSIERVSVPSRVDDFSLALSPGEVVALAGQVGSGTSEILRALAGLDPSAQVKVKYAGKPLRLRNAVDARAAGVFFISNDRKGEGLFLNRSVEQNLLATRLYSQSRLGIVSSGALHRAARALAERAAVSEHVLRTTVSTLSGGNQQKVFIGRCLDRVPTRLLLLDEPTRGVDVRGRETIHDLIRGASKQGAAVLFASSEPEEILELADVVVSLQNGRVMSIRRSAELNAESLLSETTRHPSAGRSETHA